MAEQNSQGSHDTSSTSDHSSESQEHSTGSLDNASEGGDLDFKTLFENQREEFSQELGKRDQQLGKTQKTIDNLRQALMNDGDEGGGSKKNADPIDSEITQTESEMDEIIAAAMAAEKAGRPIPLTANTAIKSLQFKIQALKDKQVHQKEMADMKAQLARLNNPKTQIDTTAFSNMDSHLMSSLQTIFGPNEDVGPQFDAISNTLIAEIQDLKKNDPKMWDRISRDRQAQVKMVNYFVKKSIPPRARQIMEEDQIRRTPLSIGELQAAFTEAKEITNSEKDPRRREQAAKHMSSIRQEILSRLMTKAMGGASKTRMSELF